MLARRGGRLALALLGGSLLLQSCATSSSLQIARDQFYAGQHDAALTTLDDGDVSSRDRLLALLDRGVIAHTAGDYDASRDALLQAAELTEDLDRLSVSEQSATLVTSEWASRYRAETSERLWIHSFLMMNFLLLDAPESAAVEARRALQVFDEHRKLLHDDWFTRALIALSFEAAGQWDSAHIEYRRMLDDWNPQGFDEAAAGFLVSASSNAERLGRSDDWQRFERARLQAAEARASTESHSRSGELVVFVQGGAIPRKQPSDIIIDIDTRIAFPFYPPRLSAPLRLSVDVEGQSRPVAITSTTLVDVARRALAERGASLATKQVLRVAAKRGLSDAARKENAALGSVVEALLFLLEQADTRSWETLPAHWAMVRIPLPAGDHTVSLSAWGTGIGGGLGSGRVRLESVPIQSGRTTFRSVRLGSAAPR